MSGVLTLTSQCGLVPRAGAAGVDHAFSRVFDWHRHADRGASAVTSNPVERSERLSQANAARAKRDPGIGLLIIASGVAILLVAMLIVWVVWRTLVKSDQIGLVLLPVFLFCWAVVGYGRRTMVREG